MRKKIHLLGEEKETNDLYGAINMERCSSAKAWKNILLQEDIG